MYTMESRVFFLQMGSINQWPLLLVTIPRNTLVRISSVMWTGTSNENAIFILASPGKFAVLVYWYNKLWGIFILHNIKFPKQRNREL